MKSKNDSGRMMNRVVGLSEELEILREQNASLRRENQDMKKKKKPSRI